MSGASTSRPCEGLTKGQHSVFDFLSRKSKGGYAGPYDYEQLSEAGYGYRDRWSHIRRVDVPELFERGLVQPNDPQEGYYRLLETCPHQLEQKNFGQVDPVACKATTPSGSLVGEADWAGTEPTARPEDEPGPAVSPEDRPTSRSAGVAQPTVLSIGNCVRAGLIMEPTNDYQLARNYFVPRCREAGIWCDVSEYKLLRRNFRAWRMQGIHLSFIRAMVDEFLQHPNWCQRSQRPASMVFVSHKAQLITMLQKRHDKNAAGQHRHDEDDSWWLNYKSSNATWSWT